MPISACRCRRAAKADCSRVSRPLIPITAHPEEPLSLSKRRLEGPSFETGLRCATLTQSLLRMSGIGLALFLLFVGALPTVAQAQSAAPDYSRDSSWLCLPGRGDTCSTPL